MTTRRSAGAFILLVWVMMAGWQVRREYFQPELARLTEATLALNPGVTFYSITMNERVVGQATSRLDTVPDGFVLEDLMSLELPALGQKGTAVARTEVTLTRALDMTDFVFTMDSEMGRFRSEGRVRSDSVLEVTIESQGSRETVEFKMAEPPVFSAIVPIRVAMSGQLEVGNHLRLPTFDPSTLAVRSVDVSVLAHDTLIVPDSAALEPGTSRWVAARYDSVPVWKIAESFGGVSVESWVDDDGRVVEASSALGFSMRRTEYELSSQAQVDVRLAGGAPAIDDDVILSTAIQSNVALDDLEEHDELRFVLSGVDLEGFALEGGRQSLRGDTLIVRREDWDALEPGYSLPYKSMDLREALQPEPLIQSDDPRIIRAAERLTARRGTAAQDPRVVARQLTRSVFSMLAKEITFSVPSAVQVLETQQGDCNEHTVLFVAMARARGLPARTAVGLVYLDGAFFYHAWPEVWLGQWVAVDPTFSQWPADAAHIRFVVGGLAQQVEIVRLIGKLGIEVVSA